MKTSIKIIEGTIHYRFKKKVWLEEALTHPSYRHEQGNETLTDNQRLEFLGDAVIGLLAAEYLFEQDTVMAEGEMTKLRSALTNRSGLARVGKVWDIGAHLRMGKGETQSGGAQRESNLADAVEAIIGAVFQDGGHRAVRKLFKLHFEPLLCAHMDTNVDLENPKGALQEYCQRQWQTNPVYRIIEEKGPSHARVYVAEVTVNDTGIGTGEGMSKRAAEAAAAGAGIQYYRGLDAGSSPGGSTSS